jgi:Uma2 family endonuclease
MNAPLMERTYTPDDLLRMPKDQKYDLVEGRLVERHMGAESSFIAGTLLRLIGAFVDAQGLGFLFPADCGYTIWPDDPWKVRYPDGSFIRRGRFPGDRVPKGHSEVRPDLAIEVISPNDDAEAVEAKVADYLQAGVPLLWVIYPGSRSIYVLRPDGSARRLTSRDELDGEGVLPGWKCPVLDVFKGI